MNAHPYPGLGGVGGAAPYPWDALIAAIAHPVFRLPPDPPAYPGPATRATAAWQANAAITQQIVATHAWADLAREQAQALADAGARSLPGGPLRDAVLATARFQVAWADTLADVANRFGQRYGHLAFAFPPDAGGAARSEALPQPLQ